MLRDSVVLAKRTAKVASIRTNGKDVAPRMEERNRFLLNRIKRERRNLSVVRRNNSTSLRPPCAAESNRAICEATMPRARFANGLARITHETPRPGRSRTSRRCARRRTKAPPSARDRRASSGTMSRHDATLFGGVRAETSTRIPPSSRSETGEKRGSPSAESTARAATASTSGRIGIISPMQPRSAPVALSFRVTNAPILARVDFGASDTSIPALRRDPPLTAFSIDARATRKRYALSSAERTAPVSPCHFTHPIAAT